MKIFFLREPLIHSHITDCLPDWHPLANKHVFCKKCGVMVHAINNECMQTWLETEFGNYCTSCFKLGTVLETLEECLGESSD